MGVEQQRRKPDPNEGHALVRRVQAELPHGTTAYREFLRIHTPTVYTRALRLLGDVPDAEDVVQDVFVRVFRAIGRYRFEQPVEHWLQRITTNSVRNLLRARHRDGRKRAEFARDPDVVSPGGAGIGDPLVAASLHASLERLEPATRIAVLLRFVEEKSYPEIAAELAMGESAVKMRVRRAIASLRTQLDPDGAEGGKR